jgi:hypothetical protein
VRQPRLLLESDPLLIVWDCGRTLDMSAAHREPTNGCHRYRTFIDRTFSKARRFPHRLHDAARFLCEMEAQDASPYRITDQQVGEVERRRADFAKGNERLPAVSAAKSGPDREFLSPGLLSYRHCTEWV